MQIRVGTDVTTPTTDVSLANLRTVFAKTASKPGVFETDQNDIIMPQAAYDSAYNTTFSTDPTKQFVQLAEFTKTFQPIDSTGVLLPAVTLPLEPKAIQDEMGEAYDTQYGRMSGMLGLELPTSSSSAQQFQLYGYASPPVDLIKGTTDLSAVQIGALDDGTQIWKINHNGVDTHTIHTHLFNAQLMNRVAWDGAMLPPDANELGWKETFRVNPLEQTVIAMRPSIPTLAQVPFLNQVPNSVRLIDPTMPEDAPLNPPPPAGFFDPLGNPVATITNHYVNLGWEYVYHCHILAHEEMDMMHVLAFALPPAAPSNLVATVTGSGNNQRVILNWTANSLNATGFTVQRADDTGFTTGLVTVPLGKVTTYTDPIGNMNQTFYYRVFASNTVGDVDTPGFPTMTVDSTFSNTAPALAPILGDANGDGSVSMMDAMLVAQCVAGLINCGTINQTAADVNCSGSVTIMDAMLVAQYVAGLIGGFPCVLLQSPVAAPTTVAWRTGTVGTNGYEAISSHLASGETRSWAMVVRRNRI